MEGGKFSTANCYEESQGEKVIVVCGRDARQGFMGGRTEVQRMSSKICLFFVSIDLL